MKFEQLRSHIIGDKEAKELLGICERRKVGETEGNAFAFCTKPYSKKELNSMRKEAAREVDDILYFMKEEVI